MSVPRDHEHGASDVPLALVTFNLGVEAGQLLFVLAVLALIAIMSAWCF